jgi:hypothetical protein
VAKDVSDETVAQLLENTGRLTGIDVTEDYKRIYTNAIYFSPIIGYTGQIAADELKELRKEDPSYDSTDIVGKVGLEKVMETALQDMLQDMADGSENLEGVYKKNHVQRCFELFGKYKSILMEIYSSGFGLKILEALNRFYEQIAGDMPANSKERFSLYVFAGSLYNTAMTWLKDGRGEDADEVAEVFCESIGIS